MDFLQQWIVPPEFGVEPWVYIVTAFVALMITAVSKGGFGGGVGVVSVPLMLQVAPLSFVLGMWLPVLIACDLATIHHYPKQWKPRVLWLLTPGMLLGIAGASLLLNQLSKDGHSKAADAQAAWLKLGVAVIALGFVVLKVIDGKKKAAAASAGDDAPPWEPGWSSSLPISLLAGVTTTLAHAAGPIITMYILPQKLSKRDFVGTTGRFFFAFNTIKIPFLVVAGTMTLMTVKYGVWLMLLGPLGVWFGSWLNHKLDAAWFTRLIYLCLVFVSGKMIWDWWSAVSALKAAG